MMYINIIVKVLQYKKKIIRYSFPLSNKKKLWISLVVKFFNLFCFSFAMAYCLVKILWHSSIPYKSTLNKNQFVNKFSATIPKSLNNINAVFFLTLKTTFRSFQNVCCFQKNRWNIWPKRTQQKKASKF